MTHALGTTFSIAPSSERGPTSNNGTRLQPQAAQDAEVRVTDQIEARANVPPELRDKYWFTLESDPGEAGQLGTTAHIHLPKGEIAIAANDDLVASVANGPFEDRERRSVVSVRRISTGSLVSRFETPLFVEHGAFALDQFFWTGVDVNVAKPGEPDLYPGGGLWANRIGSDKPELVVPPEPEVVRAIGPFGLGVRGPLQVSASGKTLASAVFLEGGVTGRVDVLDVITRTVWTTTDNYPYAGTDQYAVVASTKRPDHGGGIQLVDLATGEVEWSLWDGAKGQDPIHLGMLFAEGDRIVAQFTRGFEIVLVSIDAATGRVEELLVQDGGNKALRPVYLAPMLSSRDRLVLLPDLGIAASLAAGEGQALARVLDVAEREIENLTFTLGVP